MLCALGATFFEVEPVNLVQIEREVGGDFAAKDVVGAARPREFVGPSDETIKLEGRLFPHRFGGLSQFEGLQSMATAGSPQMFIRGDGQVFGWYIIEKVRERSTYLGARGIGRVIEFDVNLIKSPRGASAQSMLQTLLRLFA